MSADNGQVGCGSVCGGTRSVGKLENGANWKDRKLDRDAVEIVFPYNVVGGEFFVGAKLVAMDRRGSEVYHRGLVCFARPSACETEKAASGPNNV